MQRNLARFCVYFVLYAVTVISALRGERLLLFSLAYLVRHTVSDIRWEERLQNSVFCVLYVCNSMKKVPSGII